MNTLSADLLVIGGGINGAGIAADASGRGLKVCLCEKEDLASHTSSASTKLIHGGLRYLETFEFGLVRESLHERTTLLKIAPHLVHPISFLIPFQAHQKTIRSPWLVHLGLLFYENWGGNHRFHYTQKPTSNSPLKMPLKTLLSYSDCTVDDARLVITNALRAQEKGALILPRTQFIEAHHDGENWVVQLENTLTRTRQTLYAKVIVNTAGAWVESVLKTLSLPCTYHLKYVKGSHIVLPQACLGITDPKQAYFLQHPDKRIVFVIPFEQETVMIGTTDIDFKDDPNTVHIDESEIHYLCDIVNQYFKSQISAENILYSWSGLRTLVAPKTNTPSLSQLSREYKIERNEDKPLITVFGGKMTTYRSLAEKVLTLLKPYFPSLSSSWTAKEPLPGGDFNHFETYKAKLGNQYPFLPPTLVNRYVKQYGSRTPLLLKGVNALEDLGQELGPDLYEREVKYLCEKEWAMSAEDILWRRTKLGLVFSPFECEQLERYLRSRSFVSV